MLCLPSSGSASAWATALAAEQGFDIPAAVGYAKNRNLAFINTVDDDVPSDRVAPSAGPEFCVSRSPQMWMFGKEKKSARNGSDLAAGDFDVASLANDVIPDLV